MYEGGAFIGEGAQGKAYDTGDENGTPSFYSLLSNGTIMKIILYTDNAASPITELNSAHYESFKRFIKGQKNSITKTFKSGGPKTPADKLAEEIAMNKKITELYGTEAANYTTIAPLDGYTTPDGKTYNIFGASVSTASGVLEAVFGSKCDNNLKMSECNDFIALAKDIVESISVLNGKNYLHNDIKLDNIVRCGGKYKLIDWGAAIPMDFDNKTHGSLFTTSPIRWFTLGYKKFIARQIIPYKMYFSKKGISSNPYYKEQVRRIVREFNKVIDVKPPPTPQEIFEIYKNNFDIFMLGMTILIEVIKKNPDKLNEYKEIIEKFTSIENPISATDAVEFLKTQSDICTVKAGTVDKDTAAKDTVPDDTTIDIGGDIYTLNLMSNVPLAYKGLTSFKTQYGEEANRNKALFAKIFPMGYTDEKFKDNIVGITREEKKVLKAALIKRRDELNTQRKQYMSDMPLFFIPLNKTYINLNNMLKMLVTPSASSTDTSPTDESLGDVIKTPGQQFEAILRVAWNIAHPGVNPGVNPDDPFDNFLTELDLKTLGNFVKDIQAGVSDEKFKDISPLNYFQRMEFDDFLKANSKEAALGKAKTQIIADDTHSKALADRMKLILNIFNAHKFIDPDAVAELDKSIRTGNFKSYDSLVQNISASIEPLFAFYKKMYDPLYSILEDIITPSKLSLNPLLQLLDISLKQTERAIFKVTDYPDIQVIADIITKIGEVSSPADKPAPTQIDFDKLPVLGTNKYRIYPYKTPSKVGDYRELFGLRVGNTTTLDTITKFFDDKSLYLVSEFVKTAAEKKPAAAPKPAIPLENARKKEAIAVAARTEARAAELKDGDKPAAAASAVEPVPAKESSPYQKYSLYTINLKDSSKSGSDTLEINNDARFKTKPYITPFILALSILILFKKQLNSNGAGGEAAKAAAA